MKRRFTLKTFLAVISFLFSGAVFSQTNPFSVSWPLSPDTLPTVAGDVSAPGQKIGPFLIGTSCCSSFDAMSNPGWRRAGTQSSLPVGFDENAYIEYSISPAAGNFARVSQFEFSALGGGTGSARLAVYYSLNNFTTSDPMPVSATYNSTTVPATRADSIVLLNTSTTALNGREVVTFPGMSINIAPGQTLSIRMYPWITAAGSRYFPSKLVTLTGVTQGSAFPISFASAKAFQKNNGVQVEWASATEINVDKYIIEKSTDGRSFSEVGSTNARGNSTIATNYTWTDASPFSGNNFYRVKAIDKDGAVKYTSIMKIVTGRGAHDIIVSPNPVRGGKISLQINNLAKGLYSLNVYGSTGQKVFTQQLNHQGGSASQVFQLPASVKAGMYNLQLINNTVRLTKGLIVE